ncbi:type II toxin-antitoxin system PrlF family antitoxin [Pseudidiomarina sp.]|uniref:type II toxin-antitoxin system PrlF family antitoxin n=1 Tax=Pseudidiomarina sp. TaxID=2081707 RepID=UPI00299F3818|nr:type II toxin-antitoxin system PrlF family antitoxin [Pseudidiomarina sp.]MDX1706618.1 type II toxin-antitoxin system PrlF family antitoxin [Pseudidiomarina sp.]
MTHAIIQSESTLTDRYQTTVPETIRKALHLKKRDKINYTVLDNGDVVISRVVEEQSDPVIGKFLSFLANDIENNPQHLQSVDENLVNRIQSLVSDVELDLDAPLSDKDD